MTVIHRVEDGSCIDCSASEDELLAERALIDYLDPREDPSR